MSRVRLAFSVSSSALVLPEVEGAKGSARILEALEDWGMMDEGEKVSLGFGRERKREQMG